MGTSEEFVTWLGIEIEKRGWSYSETARQCGISQSIISKVMSYTSTPGLDFCVGIAKAFGIPVESVLRKAGLLPDSPEDLDDMTLREMYDLMRGLTPHERRNVLEYTRLRYRLQQEDQSTGDGKRAQGNIALRSGEANAF